MKSILVNGLLAGAASIIVYLVFYFIDPSLNINFTLGLIYSTIIYLFFLIRAGFQQRKSLGGFLGFGEVFLPSLAIYAIGSFIGLLFTTIMIKLDPELLELMREASNKVTESTMSMMGLSQDEIAIAIEEANENTEQFSLSSQLVGWMITIIFPGCIYALIASLITTKKDKSNA